MATKKTKKVDPKKIEKLAMSTRLMEFLAGEGFTVKSGAEFGFSEGTVVVATEACDIQIKLITPKSGLTRYEIPEDEDEEVVEETTAE